MAAKLFCIPNYDDTVLATCDAVCVVERMVTDVLGDTCFLLNVIKYSFNYTASHLTRAETS
jgi:hypothetical protein